MICTAMLKHWGECMQVIHSYRCIVLLVLLDLEDRVE